MTLLLSLLNAGVQGTGSERALGWRLKGRKLKGGRGLFKELLREVYKVASWEGSCPGVPGEKPQAVRSLEFIWSRGHALKGQQGTGRMK